MNDGLRNAFIEHVLKRVAIVTTDELALEQVQPGRIRIYKRVAFRNNTSAMTKAQLAIRSGTDDHLVEEQASPASTTLYWTADPIYVPEGSRLVVLFTGTTAGDDLDVWASGIEMPITEVW